MALIYYFTAIFYNCNPDISYKTTYKGPLHSMVCLFTSQLQPVLIILLGERGNAV